jgi:hypothetical protein
MPSRPSRLLQMVPSGHVSSWWLSGKSDAPEIACGLVPIVLGRWRVLPRTLAIWVRI